MKIKSDFVTNSSSTSFILAINERLTRDFFLKNIGIQNEFELDYIFNELYDAINNKKSEINDYIERYYPEHTLKSFLEEHGYDIDTIKAIKEKQDKGLIVFYGELSTDNGGGEVEVFFCCESFIICEDNFYLNCEMSGW